MLSKSFYCLTREEKKHVFFLFLIIVLTTILEFFSFGLFLPALSTVFETDKIQINFLDNFLNKINIYGLNKLNFICILLFFFYLIKNSILIIFNWFQFTFVNRILVSKSSHLLMLYMRQNYTFHANTNVSELLRNIEHEANQFQNCLLQFSQLFSELFICLAIACLLISADIKITITSVFIFTIIIYFFFKFYKKKLLEIGKKRIFYSDKMIKNLLQAFGAIKEIKVLNNENFFLKKFNNSIYEYSIQTRNASYINSLPRILIEVFLILTIVFSIIIMNYNNYKINDIFSILTIFGIAAFRFIPSINRVIFSIQTLTQLKPSVDLIYSEFKKYGPSLNYYNFANKKLVFSSSINFKNVNFAYNNQKKKIINNLSFEIKKNSFVGITGETASGKSTVLNLLLGLLDPESGKILIDNNELKNCKKAWQLSIGFVPQNIYLLDTSLIKNVAFGIPENQINLKKVKDLIDQVSLREFVDNLRDGINSNLGERGSLISGGQLQRIGIARALYHNPEILILDEITSALDTFTENEIMNLIENFKNKKTIIIISHKKRCIDKCDKIINLIL